MAYEEREPTLWEAAASNDVAIVAQRLLEPDTPVDLFNEAGASALHVAASRGHVATTRFLLEREPQAASVHLHDLESGWTALHRALYHGTAPAAASRSEGRRSRGSDDDCSHLRVVLLLIRHGALLGDHVNLGRPWQQHRDRIDSLGPLRKSSICDESENAAAAAAAASSASSKFGLDAPFESSHRNADHDGHTPLALLTLRTRDSLRCAANQGGGGELYSYGASADYQLGYAPHNSFSKSTSSPSPLPSVRQSRPSSSKSRSFVSAPRVDFHERPRRILGLARCQVVEVSACKFHSLAVSRDGRVFSWGHGRGGRLGHGDEHVRLMPTAIDKFGPSSSSSSTSSSYANANSSSSSS